MTREEINQAIQYLDQKYIPFPTFDAAINAIYRNLELYRQTGIAKYIYIAGESGAGKTSLCEWINLQLPPVRFPDRDIKPCLVVEVPAEATISSIAEAMLEALGDPSPLTGSNSAKKHRIITLCKACKVELILFDEAQHMSDRGQYKTHYLVADVVKGLLNRLDVPVVFVGLPSFESLLQVNEQLRRRVTTKLNLALGQSTNSELQTEIFQLFNSLANGMGIPIHFEPYSWQEMGKRLYYACNGLVAYLKSLLMEALEIALIEESSVNPALLEIAFTKCGNLGGVGPANPFSTVFEFRRLDRPGEPFYKAGRR